MNPEKSQSGSMLIWSLVSFSVVLVLLGSFSRTLIWWGHGIFEDYYQAKTMFLAYSGYTVAAQNWSALPLLTVPKTAVKDWIYSHRTLYYQPNLTLAGEIFLMKGIQEVYIVVLTGQSRGIFHADYTTSSGQVLLSHFRKL